jgi:hypothetical protein
MSVASFLGLRRDFTRCTNLVRTTTLLLLFFFPFLALTARLSQWYGMLSKRSIILSDLAGRKEHAWECELEQNLLPVYGIVEKSGWATSA